MIIRKETIHDILKIVIIVLFTFIMLRYVGQRAVVRGNSMQPTLQNKDSLILDKLSYRFTTPKRYDVVIFPGAMNESGKKEMYIKRVIGLPGEQVEIRDGSVFINGEKLTYDTYGAGITEGGREYSTIKLKKNEYYCLGDNRENSEDSRYIGPVRLNRKHLSSPDLCELGGVIRARIFPFTELKKRSP